jgi:hypothetical protein
VEYLKIGLSIAGVLFLVDRLGLWMERKGWLYYRYEKPKGGMGNALQEFNAFLNPSARHTLELKNKDKKQRDDQGDKKDHPL